MKKILAWMLVVALTAAVAVGGTLAYLTDTDEDVNVMTLGNVKIDQLEYERVDVETKDENAVVQEFHDNKPLYPAVIKDGFNWETDSTVDWSQIGKDGYSSGIWDPEKINNEQDKMVFVKNKGSYDAYVRSIFAFEANGYTLDQFKALFHLNINETDWTWKWEENPVSIPGAEGDQTTNYIIATATYNKVLKPGEITEISLSQIALDPSAGNADIEGFGETYQILVKTQAIQAEGFDSPDAALKDGFGDVAEKLPFENDSPIRGIDVRTALHYLNGDATGTKITDKVTTVIFGLNKDYPNIVDNYPGTLVTEEQDVEIHSYYEEKDSKYTVYFLGNGDTCLPKDSSRLFQEMTALTKVDTSSLNTAKAELMNHLFYKCGKLSDIDVSDFDTGRATTLVSMFARCESLKKVDVTNWNTSNVTTMRTMFSRCTGLEEIIGIENFDTSNVTSFYSMFQQCKVLKSIDTSKWNTGKVTEIAGMFVYCYKLESIGYVGNWNTSSLTNMDSSFMECLSLQSLEGTENWNVENVTVMSGTFKGCHSLKELDISTWDTGNVTTFRSMFSSVSDNSGAMQIGVLDVSGWDTSSCTEMSWMFYGCGQIKELDMSNWDVSKVTTMHHMFTDCFKIESYDFSGWNTASLQTIDGIFNNNNALKRVDVSDWDTATVTDFDQVFDACGSLEEIIGLDKWDTSSGQSFSEFLLGTSVQTIDLSSFDMSSATYVKNMFHVNGKLTTIYVGDNWNLDASKLSSVDAMFGSSPALTGGNGSTISSLGSNSALFARVDTEETPGLLTHINDKPNP